MKSHRHIERLIFEESLLQAAIEWEFARLLAGTEVATASPPEPLVAAAEIQYRARENPLRRINNN